MHEVIEVLIVGIIGCDIGLTLRTVADTKGFSATILLRVIAITGSSRWSVFPAVTSCPRVCFCRSGALLLLKSHRDRNPAVWLDSGISKL